MTNSSIFKTAEAKVFKLSGLAVGFLWEPKNTGDGQPAPSHGMSTSLTFTGCLAAIFLEENNNNKQSQNLKSTQSKLNLQTLLVNKQVEHDYCNHEKSLSEVFPSPWMPAELLKHFIKCCLEWWLVSHVWVFPQLDCKLPGIKNYLLPLLCYSGGHINSG